MIYFELLIIKLTIWFKVAITCQKLVL